MRREVELTHGRVDYYELGSGPPIVFAHGWLANANLWRKVVPQLAARFRCVTPDLPLGAHRTPLRPDAPLDPDGCGRLLADLVAALDLSDATLVGNDSGGAYSQCAVAQAPARFGRLVLNSCETPYDPFPPPQFAFLVAAAGKGPDTLKRALEPLRDRAIRGNPAAFGSLIKHGIDDETSDTYALPILVDQGVLHDATKAFHAASQAYVEAAAAKLIASWSRPVLFVWSPEDRFFPLENARRYAAALPDARVGLVDNAYSFTPEDQPERLARLIAEHVSVRP